MTLTLQEIARRVPHARVVGDKVVAPSPEHSKHARCMAIWLGGPEGFTVDSKTEDWLICKDFVRECLGLERLKFWRNNPLPRQQPHPGEDPDPSRTRLACRTWLEGERPQGTITETYLREARGLVLPADVQDIQHLQQCAFLLEDEQLVLLPAMLALMRDIRTSKPRAVHRTALNSDGSGKADVTGLGNPKKILGVAAGAVIKLSTDETATDGLHIAEGIEDALSAINAGIRPVWAAGSAGAIKSFPVLAGIEHLTIYGDPDDTGLNAACACRDRWIKTGRECVILLPPEGFKDWNDAWRAAR